MPDPDYEPSPMSTRRYIESDRVEGTVVYDVGGHQVGEVKRLIIEKVSGQVAFVIIAFEGFFGLGAENHALAWNKLHYDQELGGYRTEVTEDELRAAPDSATEMGNRLTRTTPLALETEAYSLRHSRLLRRRPGTDRGPRGLV